MKTNIGFLDLLFNMLLGFAILFFISFVMIRPQEKKADAKNNAEYVISVTWPNANPDDIDTWLEDPLGGMTWFRVKEKNMSHLDRDDLGYINDSLTLADGTIIKNPRNQELTTIRGFIPGEWVLNVHAYKHISNIGDTPVTVSIDKINPRFKTVFFKVVTVTEQWQEITITRFEMSANGDILSFDPMEKQLVKSDLLDTTTQ